MNIIARYTSRIFILTLLLISASALADRDHGDRRNHPDRDRGDRYEYRDNNRANPNFRYDKRYDHNRSYPREGQFISGIPKGRTPIHYHNRSYFYFGGSWYLPSGPRYVVVRPPMGIVVPILPPFYTTIWFGGVPYYYANDVYYTWRADINGYQVTEPPPIAENQTPALTADELYIYPKQNQSEQQQADDRYACHRWGVEQTHYDPTQPSQNQSRETLSHQREEYQRAMKACLEGKGYSVR